MNEKTEQQERAEFAAFVLKRWGNDDETRSQLADFHSGIYGSGPLEFAWCAWKERAASPSSKSTSLHAAIMNLPANRANQYRTTGERYAYAAGHRDARHAAAELALASSSTKEDGGGGEPVAWMHEFTDPHDGTRRLATWMNKPRDYDLQPGDTVTPLYSGSSSPPSPLGDTPIDTGDHVKHRPTGEEWLVAYVRDDKLCACGWPETLANLSDCTLVKKATRAERLALLQSMAQHSTGSRAAYALHELDRMARGGDTPEGGA